MTRGTKKTSQLHITGLCEGIHRWPVNSPHKGPVARKMFPFDDVIMGCFTHAPVKLPKRIWIKSIRVTLRWRHNDRDGVSNHQPRDCLLNRLLRRRSKETSKLCVTGLCAANSPGTGEFSAQMGSYAENVSIWWRHNEIASKYNRLQAVFIMPRGISWVVIPFKSGYQSYRFVLSRIPSVK